MRQWFRCLSFVWLFKVVQSCCARLNGGEGVGGGLIQDSSRRLPLRKKFNRSSSSSKRRRRERSLTCWRLWNREQYYWLTGLFQSQIKTFFFFFWSFNMKSQKKSPLSKRVHLYLLHFHSPNHLSDKPAPFEKHPFQLCQTLIMICILRTVWCDWMWNSRYEENAVTVTVASVTFRRCSEMSRWWNPDKELWWGLLRWVDHIHVLLCVHIKCIWLLKRKLQECQNITTSCV